jgi:putative MATE family efflux protein
MTGTGAVGLMAIFLGDLANILFLSLLRDVEVIAAVGYASSILFFTTSIGIGLGIAATCLVAPAIGAGRQRESRRFSASAHVLSALVGAATAVLVWILVPSLLHLLGATGRAHALAGSYLRIAVASVPFLAAGMCSSAVLRSGGDARRAMHVMLLGAIVNTALDPLFIFGLHLGIEGAAIATSLSRLVMMAVGLNAVVRVHGLWHRIRLDAFLADAKLLGGYAVPAVLTNVATPAANAYVTAAIAAFGDDAVAGWAIVGRILPVAFGSIFALSGSVGPVLGQNLGARDFARVRLTFTSSLVVTAAFTAAAWALLAASYPALARLFGASPEAATLVALFCYQLAPLFFFLGALFVANAAFNTLGHPHYSTAFNWGRATLGMVPFVEVGGRLAGAKGVLTGSMLGGVVFGTVAVWLCYRVIDWAQNAAAARLPHERL